MPSMLPRLVAVLVLSAVASAAPQQAQPTAPSDAGAWPPARAFRPGHGVIPPRLLSQVTPQYTSDAMRQKIAGKAGLECVVETDGTVQRVRVVRSVDKLYGLDEQAIKAAKQWRFAPGMKDGEAVPVLITIDMAFTLGGRPG